VGGGIEKLGFIIEEETTTGKEEELLTKLLLFGVLTMICGGGWLKGNEKSVKFGPVTGIRFPFYEYEPEK
jgi:hypothetical protein